MQIMYLNDRTAEDGNPAYFTGKVSLKPLLSLLEPARLRGAEVTFDAGARTAWHTHPLGQTLLVVAGTCLAQTDGGRVQKIEAGSIAWFASGEKHWHGATPNGPMTHLAFQEALDGETVTWLEAVTNEVYGG
jgi:quercetin dioxygenase-like cupin family protein